MQDSDTMITATTNATNTMPVTINGSVPIQFCIGQPPESMTPKDANGAPRPGYYVYPMISRDVSAGAVYYYPTGQVFPSLQYPQVDNQRPYPPGCPPAGYTPMDYCPPAAARYPSMQMPYVMPYGENATVYATDAYGNLIPPMQQHHMQHYQQVGGNNVTDENSPPQIHSTTGSVEGDVIETQPLDPAPNEFYDSKRVRQRSLNSSFRRQFQKPRSGAYKTMLCNMFTRDGKCSFGAECQYAHGMEELRPIIPHPKYKTQMCNKFNTARGCRYGDKCHFRHPGDPLTPPDLSASMQQFNTSHSTANTPMHAVPRLMAVNTNQRVQQGADSRPSAGYRPGHSSQYVTPTHAPPTINHGGPGAAAVAFTPVAVKKPAGKPQQPKTFSSGHSQFITAEDVKNKQCIIKLSMYHHFESYVGKRHKKVTMKRSNSCSTVGLFTFERFLTMQNLVKAEVNRFKKKQHGAGGSPIKLLPTAS